MVCQAPSCRLDFWQLAQIQAKLGQVVFISQQVEQVRSVLLASALEFSVCPSEELVRHCTNLSARCDSQASALWLAEANSPSSSPQLSFARAEVTTLKSQAADVLVFGEAQIQQLDQAELGELCQTHACFLVVEQHANRDQALAYLGLGVLDIFSLDTNELAQQIYAAYAAFRRWQHSQQLLDTHQQALTEQQQASVTLAAINDGVIRVNTQLEVEYLNPTAANFIGLAPEQVIGQALDSVFQIYHEFSKVAAINPVQRCLEEQQTVKASQKVILRDHQANEYLIEHSAAPILDQQAQLQGAVLVFRDFTETSNMERKLSFQAQHDSLTGLYNREVLDRHINAAIEETNYSDTSHCLFHINLHHFRLINDSCGHDAGDRVLREVGQLVRQCIREPADTLARVRGNEFGLLLRHCPLNAATQIAEKIIRAISEYQYLHNEQHYHISSSIGIACIDQAQVEAQEVSACAETACQIAQEQGVNSAQVFNVENTEQAQRRGVMKLVTQLIKAEKNDQFELYCQEISPVSGCGKPSYELLLRMHTDDNTMVAPGVFLSAAERYHLMPSIDRWVLRNAFEFFSKQPSLMAQVEHFTINLSGQSLIDDACYEYIDLLLKTYHLDACKICFEITETAAISNYTQAIGFINRVRKLGCKFSLDDFGSGMSSFAYLKELPVDFLKIDGLFIKNLANDEIDKAMVTSINDIGHVMKLKTVAEFVENQATLEILKQLGVDYAQGYHLCRPFPLSDLQQQILLERQL